MSNDLSKTNGGGRSLSQDLVAGLMAGIQEHRATTTVAGGKPLLRLLKAGNWVFGQQDDPVQEGSEWAINPLSIKHGWCCWSDYPGNTKNELLGEILTPISDHKPPMPDPIQTKSGTFPWKELSVFELRCMNGEDEGVEVIYKGSSIGATRAVDGLFAQLVEQLKLDSSHPVAVVQLKQKDYQHSKWGQTFNPIFEVVGWATMTGEFAEEEPIEAVQAPKPTPTPSPTPPTPEQPSQPSQPPSRPAKPPLRAVQPDETVAARPGAVPRRQRPVGRDQS
jgi:hypothetical protein